MTNSITNPTNLKTSFGTWGRWAKRVGICKECPEPIEKGTEIIMSAGRTPEGYSYRNSWHLECWVKQLRRYLAEHPYIIKPGHPGKGRPSFNLTGEQRLCRRALITKFSRLGDKKREAVDLGLMVKLESLQQEGREMMAAMKDLGGVPKSWLM